jgi:hypothetical protein
MKLCQDCEECVYICDEDYLCIKNCNDAKIVIEDNMPTDNYMWCNKAQ